MPALIAFDADDTLWENEIYFETAKDRFTHLLASDCDPAWTERELYETEMRNLWPTLATASKASPCP